jgi:Papain-like cysteine protease AvrRpt2
MAMDWRYGNIHGINPVTGAARTQHTTIVQGAKATNRGYNLGNVPDYGLRRVLDADMSTLVDDWAAALRAGGPMLAGGTFGPARIVGGHVVLIVGISGSNQVCYLDPFLIGMKAILGNHLTYVSSNDAYNRLNSEMNLHGKQLDLFQMAPGAADHGFGW